MNKISKKRPAVQSKPAKRKRRVLLMLILPFAAFMLLLTYLEKQNTEIQDTQPNGEVPSEFMPIYKAAETEYGVPWYLLAAHHRVETIFSTMDPMISPVGAEGHMQFMPCTFVGWAHPSCEGLGEGDIPEDEKTDPAVIKKYGGYGVDANGDGKQTHGTSKTRYSRQRIIWLKTEQPQATLRKLFLPIITATNTSRKFYIMLKNFKENTKREH